MQSNSTEVINLFRNWKHYTNLYTSLHNHIKEIKRVIDEYEKKIIGKIQERTIRTSEESVRVSDERIPVPLTMEDIEKKIHAYFIYKKKTGKENLSTEIIKYIQDNREYTNYKKLKRTVP